MLCSQIRWILTAAGLAIQVEDVALLASAHVRVGGTDAVVFTAMVPQVTEINFCKRLRHVAEEFVIVTHVHNFVFLFIFICLILLLLSF